ncbi:MAG: Abortive infection protein [Candidatus Moranbacteria bacterium GW2011_GWE1_35_17]|nr:MAG: Abortive infection protein [Candidatus Moranbacteria bacterium GW2011_GWE1_35_17]KKP84079.1 MAG: Abortive infection protein [Candidatus Moranbacteria bacterium GW2011_GWF1_35_5]
MITKLRVGNFYSVGEEIELNFTKGGAKKEVGYFPYKKNEKISLINGFFGANASGKSNILGSMVGLIRMMYTVSSPQSISPQSFAGGVMLCHPNVHKNFKDKPTKLGIDFLFGDNYYIYDLEIKNGNDIIKESLYLITLNLKSAKPKEIFTRKGLGISFGPEYKEYKNYLDNINIQKYQTFVSHLINIGAKAMVDFVNHRDSFFLKIDGLDAMIPSQVAILNRALTLNSYTKDRKEEFLETTKGMMSCFDDSIDGLEVNTDNNAISIKVSHKNFSGSIDIMQESAGTRELFAYIYDILSAFKKGGIVIYDETNRFYHPDVELALLSIFKNEEFNAKNAQLFFASHNHETFDLLELDQAYIVEKTDSSSTVYKLSEIEDLKKRDNLKKKYRLGMLGGISDAVAFDHKLKQLL